MTLLDDGTPAPIVVDRYELGAEIGSGGMAAVHLGRLRGSGGLARAVAIKRLHPNFAKDPELAAMLLDEARVTMRIRHPNVVPTLDVVATGSELFLVMEFVLGDSLAALLRASRSGGAALPPRVVAAIVVDLLHGLHAAHEAIDETGEPLAIVHRDVSPHNVLVGADGLSRVLDFGIAKAVGRHQTTRDGRVKGKLAYMAPEQITSGVLDRRVDVFAAGIVLWEALAGETLFAHDGPARTLDAVLRDPIAAPGTIAPSAAALDAVVLRGLERDPDRRFATARAMAEAIEAATPLASRSEVADALAARLGPTLEERRALVRATESLPRVPLRLGAPSPARRASDDADATQPDAILDAASAAPADAPTPPASPRRLGARAIGLAVILVAASAVAIAARASLRAEAVPATAPSASAASPGPSAPPAASASTPSDVATAEAAAPPVEPSASAPRRGNKAARPTPNCRDPFRRDDGGILLPRPECFR